MNDERVVRQEKELFQLMDQILQVASHYKAALRVLGATAIRIHCPHYKYIEYKLGRELSDIDFVAYSNQARGVEKAFKQFGWNENKAIRMFTQGKRWLFITDSGIHLDIFFDRVDMCHEINLKGRLGIDYPTISLVDLLLEKMQIVQINEKDLIDTAVLLLEHDIGDSNKETIDISYLCSLCSSDWGLWRTVTTNLRKVELYSSSVRELSEMERRNVQAKVTELLQRIVAKPKSLSWRLRAKIGDKKKWYRDVDEMVRET